MFALERCFQERYVGYAAVKAEIEGAKKPENDERKKVRGVVSHVLEGIHLGNDEKFVETMGSAYTCTTEKKVAIDTSNPHNFKVIVSSCSWKRMCRAMPDLAVYKQDDVERSFQERAISWIQIGGSVPDDTLAWTDMVYNATFPHSDLTKIDLDIPRKREEQTEEMRAHRERKNIAVQALPVHEWFKETFAVLDDAIIKSKKTLVHCHAGGSRSPALLAAYLINRFEVTADQAITFLRSKRRVVKPKCKDDLTAYHIALQQLNELATK